MKIGSLFTGVGGFDLGFERAGHEVVWQVEFDKRAQSVLRRHWPQVELYSDVREVGGRGFRSGHGRREGRVERDEKHDTPDGNLRRSSDCENEGATSNNILSPVDLICGGFPCQDLSLAGHRKGLAGDRSGLWTEFHRIIGELAPTWVLIENVLGLLSSNDGADMRVVLRGLEELGYGWNYRVLDSQYFGVPQRRRRVFIVGNIGGYCPPEILLEPEGVIGGAKPRRKQRQKITSVAKGSLEQSDRGTGHWDGGPHPPLDAQRPGTSNQNMLHHPGATVVWDDRVIMRGGGFSNYKEDDIAGCLRASGKNGADVDLIIEQPSNEKQPTVFRKAQKAHDADDSERWEAADKSNTLSGHGTTTSEVILTERPASSEDGKAKAFYDITPTYVGRPTGFNGADDLIVGASPQHEAFKKDREGRA